MLLLAISALEGVSAAPHAPVLFMQNRLGFVPVCSRRPMIEVTGPQPPIVPTSHKRNVCAHGVSHVPKYTLPKSPRRPRPELRAVALPSNVPLSRAIFKLNSAWNHAVIPPPTVSVERRPQFDAWLVTPNFVVSSSVPSVLLVYLAWLSDRCTVPYTCTADCASATAGMARAAATAIPKSFFCIRFSFVYETWPPLVNAKAASSSREKLDGV